MPEQNENHGAQDRKKNKDKVDYRVVILFAVCIIAFMLLFSIDAVKSAFSWFISVLSPVILGVVMAYIINPLYVFLNKKLYLLFSKGKAKEKTKKKYSNGLAIGLSVFFLIAVIALLLFLIIPEFLQNLKILIDRIPGLISDVTAWFEETIHSDSEFLQNFSAYIDAAIGKMNEWINTEFSTAVEGLLSFATSSVISVVSFLFDFLVAIVICIYALLEKNKFISQGKKLTFALFSKPRANDILAAARYGNDVFGKFVSGKIITSTIVGVLTFLFMTIMGMPYALLSAVILGITNVIPFFGPFIGGIPTAFIVLITDVQQGVIYIIFMIVLQQIEGNIIEPSIMEDRTGVSKFWVTFALLFFGGLFGVLGMVISVPLFALIYYVVKLLVDRRLVSKNMPVPSDVYLDVGSIDCDTNELLPNPVGDKKQSSIAEFGRSIAKRVGSVRARLKKRSDDDEDK